MPREGVWHCYREGSFAGDAAKRMSVALPEGHDAKNGTVLHMLRGSRALVMPASGVNRYVGSDDR